MEVTSLELNLLKLQRIMYDLLRRENLLMLNLSSCKILESVKEAKTNHYILIGLPLYT